MWASPSGRHRTFWLPPDEGCLPANLEHLPRVEQPEKLDQLRHHSRPPRLVSRAQSRPVVPVEVLVEQDVVTPVRAGRDALTGSAVAHRPTIAIRWPAAAA